MPYIDARGNVRSSPPLLERLVALLHSLWLALCLFVSTLFNPNSTSRLPPSSSLRDRERRRRDDGGAGGGRGGGPRGGGRLGGASSGPSVVFSPNGGCGPCGGVQM